MLFGMQISDVPHTVGFDATAPLPGVVLARAAVVLAAAAAPAWATALPLPAPWPIARRQECIAGRALAAQALQAIGVSAAVGRDAQGLPQWPPGTVGSIGHAAGQAVAVAAHAAQWRGLGVDVESDAALPDDAASLVLTAPERAALARLPTDDAVRLARWLFSAKECVHKALNPLNGAWLEFDEVAIQWCGTLPKGLGEWRIEPLTTAAREALQDLRCEGRWWAEHGAVYALLGIAA